MIKSIRLQNFFGFQDCTINLEKGENVLVGINGSGKSNFLKAIRLLKEGVAGIGVEEAVMTNWQGFHRVYHIPSQGSNKPLQIDYSFGFKLKGESEQEWFPVFHKDGAVSYKYIMQLMPIKGREYDYYTQEELHNFEGGPIKKVPDAHSLTYSSSNGKFNSEGFEEIYSGYDKHQLALPVVKNDYQIRPLADYISSINIYERFDTSSESKMRSRTIPQQAEFLSHQGDNLCSLLHTLSISDKISYRQIIQALKVVNNKFESIDFEIFDNEIALRLGEVELTKSISAKSISDGTLRFLCLMAIFYNPNRGSVICIDEPEVGLHPDMIRTVAEAIKYAGQTSQIIISTHSEQLLNYFDIENIRVFEKDENNATIVNQFSSETFKDWFDEYTIGQLWRNGHLGGNRW